MIRSIDLIANTPLTNGSTNAPLSDGTTYTPYINGTNNTPLSNGSNGTVGPTPISRNVASISHSNDPAVVEHYTVQRVIDVDCGVGTRPRQRDQCGAEAINTLGQLPAGTLIIIRGQSQAMRNRSRRWASA